MTRPLVPLYLDAVLAELPERAQEALQIPAEQLRDRIERRIRVYDGVDMDTAPSASIPESAPPVNPAEQPTSESSFMARPLRLYVAAAIITALITYSAVLLWR